MFPFLQSKENADNGKSKKPHLWIILFAGAVGIALLLFGSQSSQEKTKEEKEIYTPSEDELVLYQSYLEERVKTLCESVAGVGGNVTAVVTLSGSFESVYATEQINGNEEYVIIGSGANAAALFLSRSAPEIAGIGVVCPGGDDTTVCRELTALLCATFHIPSNRIYITKATS